MKIEKIDITKTLIDIPENRDRMDFVQREPLSAFSIPEGQIPLSAMMSATKKTYLVQKVGYDIDKAKSYLVSVDEREIFNDLISITDTLFNRAVEKKTEHYRDLIGVELYEQRAGIKRLPFWRRLFNRF